MRPPIASSDHPHRDVAETRPEHIVEDLKTGDILDILGDKPRIFHVGHRKVSVYTTNGWKIYIWGGQRGENMIFISAECAGGNHQIVLYTGNKETGNILMKLREKMSSEIFVRGYIETPEKQKPNYFQKPQES